MIVFIRIINLTIVLILALMYGGKRAIAQPAPVGFGGIIPAVKTTDEHGVDMITGALKIEIPIIEASESTSPLSISFNLEMPDGGMALSSIWRLTFGQNDQQGITANIIMSGGGGSFLPSAANAIVNSDGSKIQHSFGPTHATYFDGIGAASDGYYNSKGIKFIPGPALIDRTMGEVVLPSLIEKPDGEVWTIHWDIQPYPSPGCGQHCKASRQKYIVSSRGYAIQFKYLSNSLANNYHNWILPAKVTLYNKAVIYCEESSVSSCPDVDNSKQYTSFIYDVQNASIYIRKNGQSKGYKIGKSINGLIESFGMEDLPDSETVYTYSSASDGSTYSVGYIGSVTKGGATWRYTHFREMLEGRITALGYVTRTNPDGTEVQGSGMLAFGYPDMIDDGYSGPTYYGLDYGHNYRIYGNSKLDGFGIALGRDSRNNITSVTKSARVGSGLDSPTATAIYPTQCTNPKTCNKPTSVMDFSGGITTYTYDPVHGGVLTITEPAAGGINPQKRFQYQQRFAWIRNSTGGYQRANSAIWTLTSESYCRTTAASAGGCSGGPSDEVVTTYDYGPDSGPNNLNVRGIVVSAQGQILRTCQSYDEYGRNVSETAPAANLQTCP